VSDANLAEGAGPDSASGEGRARVLAAEGPLRPRLVWVLLSGGLPLAAYLATAGGSSYFLDAGELLSASVALDIAHPPGEPLSALYGKLLGLLPLGSLSFRMALGQSLAAAFACAALFVVAWRALGALVPALPAAVRVPVALLAPALWGSSYAVWMQAVRPEVYALQAALLLIASERLAAFHTDDGPTRDARPLYVAALAVGLGLANHHAMSVLAIPALVHAAARTRRLRPWLWCAALGGLGLLVYVYLPVRALTDPPFNVGDPRTLERLLWVVSARVYAWRVGDADVEPIAERFSAALVVALDVAHPLGLALALLGGYFLLRGLRSRALGVGLWLQAAAALVISPLLNPPRGNPDAMGYMALGLAALSVFASAGLAVLLSALCSRGEGASRLASRVAAAVLIGFTVEHVTRNYAAVDLSHFVASDAIDDLRVRALPPRSLLVATMPQTVFRIEELSVVDRVRPDVVLLALPLASYPGAVEALSRSTPELEPLAAAFQASGGLSPDLLYEVATRRPVLLELDAHVAPSLYPNLIPVGGLHALVDPRAAPLLWRSARRAQRIAYGRLEAELGGWAGESETIRQRLYMHYMDAVHAAALGRRAAADEALQAALQLAPQDARLLAFAAALAALPEGTPLDVTPLVGLSPRR